MNLRDNLTAACRAIARLGRSHTWESGADREKAEGKRITAGVYGVERISSSRFIQSSDALILKKCKLRKTKFNVICVQVRNALINTCDMQYAIKSNSFFLNYSSRWKDFCNPLCRRSEYTCSSQRIIYFKSNKIFFFFLLW